MKNFLFTLFVVATSLCSAQYREFYSGASLNNYHWSYPNAQFNYSGFEAGFHAGLMSSPKLKLVRAIGNGFISPYASFEYNLSRFNFATQGQMHIHAVRVSLPTRLKIMSFSGKRHSIYALVDPGVNLSFFQTNSIRNETVPKINPIDLFINAGIGSTLNSKPKDVKKAGYKFSGVSLSASKYMPLGLIRSTNFTSTGFLDQLRFNVGMRFTYLEPKKEKKSLFKKIFGK